MGRQWVLSFVAAWCAFLSPDAALPVKYQFEVSADQTGLKIADFAAGPDRLYFLFTGAEKSELKAFDLTGRLVGGVTLKSRAGRISAACAHDGMLVIRPRPVGESHIEEYSPDLKFERAGTYDDSFETVYCSGKEAVALGRGGTLDVLNLEAGTIGRRSPLVVPGNDPILRTATQGDFFVQIQVFSGALQIIGYDGLLRGQRSLSGPGLDEFRATLEEGEGLFGFAATDSSGVYVVLGRASPATGMAIQKYDFDGNFVRELRLPLVHFNRLLVRDDAIYVVDFRNRRVIAFGLSIP